MSDQLLFWIGNERPSITDTIESAGAPVDLSGSTVKFKMRAVNSATLKVDHAVSNTPGVDGVVRYDWTSADVDTPGQFIVWWEVTTGGKTQDMNEAVIEFRDHAPATIPAYVELEQLKSTLELTGNAFADQDIQVALQAASRTVDAHCNRRFYADPDAMSVRYFEVFDPCKLIIDDLIQLTALKTDLDGDGTYEQTWATTDYILTPRNAQSDLQPWTAIERTTGGNFYFTAGYRSEWWPSEGPPTVYPMSVARVQVTGRFGWESVPPAVTQATTVLAGRLLKRARETPYGVVGLGLDGGAVRITRVDPDVEMLLMQLVRRAPGTGGALLR